jgi:hypothetical protein
MQRWFPIRARRSQQPLGQQNRDQGRWSMGIKSGWILHPLGPGVGWHGLRINCPDQALLPLVDWLRQAGRVLSDLGFRCKAGIPVNLKRGPQGTWYDRRLIEPAFSLLTGVCQGKQLFHPTAAHLQARLADPAARFKVLLRLFWPLHPEQAFKLSIAEFSL